MKKGELIDQAMELSQEYPPKPIVRDPHEGNNNLPMIRDGGQWAERRMREQQVEENLHYYKIRHGAKW